MPLDLTEAIIDLTWLQNEWRAMRPWPGLTQQEVDQLRARIHDLARSVRHAYQHARAPWELVVRAERDRRHD